MDDRPSRGMDTMGAQRGIVETDRDRARAGLTRMLGRALDWAALLRDRRFELQSECRLTERDVIALGLLVQIAGVETIHCVEPDIAESLPAPDWLTLLPHEPTAAAGTNLILAPPQAVVPRGLVGRAEAGDRIVLYGLRDAVTWPAIDMPLVVLATVNPALWSTGLAVLVPKESGGTDRLVSRLGAILGDQSLDPLDLYEEVCRLRAQTRIPEGQNRAEQDLRALRRYVRGLIERAALASRRDAARSKRGRIVDWSSAFQLPPELRIDAGDALDEAEVRARRARIEAEFLRGQLRSATIPRDVDHHALVAGSGLFDVTWYSERYDVPPNEAIRHYLESGYLQMNDPSPYFSTSAYLTAYPDVRNHGFNPLLHYLMDGIYEGRPIGF